MKITSAVFLKSVINIDQCPNLGLPEFAFFGRSNVWKSSLINTICNRKNLAKSSNTPWKTKLFNFFVVNDSWVLVDLPWYWYAKSWNQDKKQWLDFSQEFLSWRKNLKQAFLLIDWSIPPQKNDIEMLECFREENIKFSIVFTKIDKCNQKKYRENQRLFSEKMWLLWLKDVKSFFIDNIHWIGKDELVSYMEMLV